MVVMRTSYAIEITNKCHDGDASCGHRKVVAEVSHRTLNVKGCGSGHAIDGTPGKPSYHGILQVVEKDVQRSLGGSMNAASDVPSSRDLPLNDGRHIMVDSVLRFSLSMLL